MTTLRTAALTLAVLATSALPALAWEKVDNPYGWATLCDDNNCYTPGVAYSVGHYSYLVCKQPGHRLTYVDNVLTCVPRVGVK